MFWVIIANTFIIIVTTSCTKDYYIDFNDFSNTISENIDTAAYTDSILVISHWNIGHFSNGKSQNTTITSHVSDSLKLEYEKFIQSLNSNIFGICEYNPTFNIEGDTTAKLLFHDFPYCYIGRKYAYNCNAVFSKMPIDNGASFFFAKSYQKRYYSVVELTVNYKKIKFVETHLDFNQGNGKECRLSQMNELVNAFAGDSCVILCADYNSSDLKEYKVFRDAGYIFASDYLSQKMDSDKVIIDNILVKGFTISSASLFYHKQLSDHNLISCKLLFR